MYNTLITSLDEAVFNNETIIENPTLSQIHISSEEDEDYPYNQQEYGSDLEVPAGDSVKSYLSAKINIRQTALNESGVKRSGIPVSDIMIALKRSVDVDSIRRNMADYNQGNPNEKYLVDITGQTADAVLTEAVHQFQVANYIAPKEHDGVLGQSTFETLGFFNNRLRPQLAGSGIEGQVVINSLGNAVAANTSNEFTAGIWFNYIMKPAWLGIRIHDGVHLMLLRKLKEAENWLLGQPKYKGMTPASLGRALGFDEKSRYSASRLFSKNQAMHSLGLAIDIDVPGNPWIGAGWIRFDKELLKERYRMIDAFRKASGNQSLPGTTVFAYLNHIAETYGNDTLRVYTELKQRNDEFVSYLGSNTAELDYWKRSQTFGGRNPLKGFLNHHPDLVFALRQVAGLAWGAVDFGPYASGDIMHFDNRTIGFGTTLCKKIGGFVSSKGTHPAITNELSEGGSMEQFEWHEAEGEANWNEEEI